jgi:hypothetical protein
LREPLRAFSKCRNEALRIRTFLQHYRRLGVDRFFIIDNDSTDGTAEYLAQQQDVSLIRTPERFSDARGGTDWLNPVLREFGAGGWCVTVDIDELLVYPGHDGTSLAALTRYLDRQGSEALACLLLDLYPAGPVRSWSHAPGDDLLQELYFDPRPYERTPVGKCPGVLIRGGVRERVFYPEFRQRGRAARVYDAALGVLDRLPLVGGASWIQTRRRPVPPCLTKVPLVRWNQESRYLYANHWVSPKVVAPETGVLLHLKLLGDFHQRALEESARGAYYDGGSEYRRYAQTLDRNPDLTILDDDSVRYEEANQLVRLGLMQDTRAWQLERGAASE